ncbi:MAG: SUMF1/EgtB/PvdO family nonheme iron enzyme [Polyangiaceae bacterium]
MRSLPVRSRFAVPWLLAAVACGGTTDEDRLIPEYPKTGCPPSHEKVDGVCTVKEVFFPGGTFTLGAGYCDHAGALDVPPDLTDCPLADQPRTVTVKPFWVDATVLSAVLHPNPADEHCPSLDLSCARERYAPVGGQFGFLGGLDPVEGIENSCIKRGKRWLTEVEWEYIVTAGGTRKFPWGDRPPRCSDGNLDYEHCGNPNALRNGALPELSLVGTFSSSPEGVFDLVGGLGEMLAANPEAYAEDYTAVPLRLPDCPNGWGTCDGWIGNIPTTVRRGGNSDTPLDELNPMRRGVINGGDSAFRCARSAE